MGKDGAGARSTRFVRDNLALLGFGGRKDALVQAVKELFENALDATGAMNGNCDWEDAPLDLLRVCVRTSTAQAGFVDIVCADTGGGIRTHHIKALCCGAFETTKRAGGDQAAVTAGKYGVGLKAAVLYSQLFDNNASLRVVTTSSSTEILCVNLQINSNSEEAAVVQSVAHFSVDESHQRFSGTEMRLTIPCPESLAEVEDAADQLAMYFQTLGYTLPPFVSVTFSFEVSETSTLVELKHGHEPVDRFIEELEAHEEEEVVFEYQETDEFSVSCMGVLKLSEQASQPAQVDVCLLRYVNHVPLLNMEDLFVCGITTGVAAQKTWKRYGLRCRETSTPLVTQLVAAPVSPADKSSPEDRALLVVAVDVCSRVDGHGIKYSSMRKTRVDKSYARPTQACFAAMLCQLEAAGRLLTPQQQQLKQLTADFAPLIARAALAITSQPCEAPPPDVVRSRTPDEAVVVRRLQRALHHQASLSSR